LIIPEANWENASGGGQWISEVQVVDISGGSVIEVYYNTGANRRGPFTLWDNGSGGAGSAVKFSNILETIDGLDGEAFTYFGTHGALEFVTQDASHVIQAAVRTFNGNCSRTFPAFIDTETNTAAVGRNMVIPNISNDGNYRPSVALFNPSSESINVNAKIIGNDGVQVGSTMSVSLSAYQMYLFDSVANIRGYTYSNASIVIEPVSGAGRVLVTGQTGRNGSNDPASHIAVQMGAGYDKSPAGHLIFSEVNWENASGGGQWISEVNILDITGGSVIQVYYNTGTTRRGPFTLWSNSSGSSLRSTIYTNILETIAGLDSGFTYSGTHGALELVTQDGSHLIQAAVRTYNNNYSRTFPAFADVEANSAAVGRDMVIPNMAHGGGYRPSLSLFNMSSESVNVDVKIIGSNGSQLYSTVSFTLAGYEMRVLASELRDGKTYDNASIQVQVTSGSGRVLVSGQSGNNATNDPAAHIAVQKQ
jgi:osmotically-inducible protein OsmY